MNELMRVYGHYYLVKTIKPVLDRVSDHIVYYSQSDIQIYTDRLCCEVDPSKLQVDEDLQTNQVSAMIL